MNKNILIILVLAVLGGYGLGAVISILFNQSLNLDLEAVVLIGSCFSIAIFISLLESYFQKRNGGKEYAY